MHYNVFAIVQSPKNLPVAIKYGTNTNAIGAAHAITTILNDFENDRENRWDPNLIEIKVEVV
jgi:hypothetical protein